MNNTITRRDARAAEARKPIWKRKRWLLGLGLPLFLMGATGAAALYFALAGITGSGQSGDFTAKWAATVPVMDTTGLTVKPLEAAAITNNKLALPNVTMYPSESFTVDASIVSGGSTQRGYVNGVTMPGLPSGATVTLEQGCGALVTTSMTNVKIKVTMPASLTPGASWTLGAAGVTVSPLATGQSAPATTCPAYTAP